MKLHFSRSSLLIATLLVSTLILFTTCQKGIVDAAAGTREFVTFTVNGVSHTWESGPYHYYAKEDTDTHGIGFYYNMLGAYDTTIGRRSIDLVILRPEIIAAKPPYKFDIESIFVDDITAPLALKGDFFPLLVSQADITEFGAIGEFIAGNFSCVCVRSIMAGPVDTVQVSCNWKIKREPF